MWQYCHQISRGTLQTSSKSKIRHPLVLMNSSGVYGFDCRCHPVFSITLSTSHILVKRPVNNGIEECCNSFHSWQYVFNGQQFQLLSFQMVALFSYLFPLEHKENHHDNDFLKHHNDDVEDTLAQPCCALNWLSCINTHTNTQEETEFCEKNLLTYSDMQHRLLLDFIASELHKVYWQWNWRSHTRNYSTAVLRAFTALHWASKAFQEFSGAPTLPLTHQVLTIFSKTQRVPLPPLYNSTDGSHPSIDQQHTKRCIQQEVYEVAGENRKSKCRSEVQAFLNSNSISHKSVCNMHNQLAQRKTVKHVINSQRTGILLCED